MTTTSILHLPSKIQGENHEGIYQCRYRRDHRRHSPGQNADLDKAVSAAACEGALESGASGILIEDAHGRALYQPSGFSYIFLAFSANAASRRARDKMQVIFPPFSVAFCPRVSEFPLFYLYFCAIPCRQRNQGLQKQMAMHGKIE